MTLPAFTSLPADSQMELLYQRGTCIAMREEAQHEIHLYQVDAFYAEVYFIKEDGSVLKICGFDQPLLLKPYLDDIDISELLPA